MTSSKRVPQIVSWSIAAVLSPFALISIFFVIAPSDWNYCVGIGLAEFGGIACLFCLPCVLWIRILCVAVYVPVFSVLLYFYSFFFIYGILGKGPH
jgi:hypothetical protein